MNHHSVPFFNCFLKSFSSETNYENETSNQAWKTHNSSSLSFFLFFMLNKNIIGTLTMLVSSHIHFIISKENKSKIVLSHTRGASVLHKHQPPKLGQSLGNWVKKSQQESTKYVPLKPINSPHSYLLPEMQTKGQQFFILFSVSPLNFGRLSITVGWTILSSFMTLVCLINYNIASHIFFCRICCCILCYKFASS